jgi:hypothetical protein
MVSKLRFKLSRMSESLGEIANRGEVKRREIEAQNLQEQADRVYDAWKAHGSDYVGSGTRLLEHMRRESKEWRKEQDAQRPGELGRNYFAYINDNPERCAEMEKEQRERKAKELELRKALEDEWKKLNELPGAANFVHEQATDIEKILSPENRNPGDDEDASWELSWADTASALEGSPLSASDWPDSWSDTGPTYADTNEDSLPSPRPPSYESLSTEKEK